MSCRLRDFSSLGDTMDVVRLGNNDLSLPLSKGKRRQWLVTNMVQSLPDHIKRHHRASRIPDASLVIGGDTKWCLSYNGQSWDCENSCHATYQLPFWGLSHWLIYLWPGQAALPRLQSLKHHSNTCCWCNTWLDSCVLSHSVALQKHRGMGRMTAPILRKPKRSMSHNES